MLPVQGPFQFLVSSESPLWYSPPQGAEKANKLSIRDRICFLSPVFNTVVNCLSTPFYCFVPCFFIWSGRFPASLNLASIIAAVTATAFTMFFKFFARPGVGVRTVTEVLRSSPSPDAKFQVRECSRALKTTRHACMTLPERDGKSGKLGDPPVYTCTKLLPSIKMVCLLFLI